MEGDPRSGPDSWRIAIHPGAGSLSSGSSDFELCVAALADAAGSFYQRGWALGTSGNFSAVLALQPMRLAITGSGLPKGELQSKDFLIVDEFGNVLTGVGTPSAETQLHIAIAHATKSRAIMHTHSVWATVLSERFASAGGLGLTGYEMLKGLAGVKTHEHREWIPILENSQDYTALAHKMKDSLATNPSTHGILLRRHGLYTWGREILEARRHVEILEFLFEVTGRLGLD